MNDMDYMRNLKRNELACGAVALVFSVGWWVALFVVVLCGCGRPRFPSPTPTTTTTTTTTPSSSSTGDTGEVTEDTGEVTEDTGSSSESDDGPDCSHIPPCDDIPGEHG